MKIYHNSREEKYRKPFGAVPSGTAIELSVEVTGAAPEDVRLMLWRGDAGMPDFKDMRPVFGGITKDPGEPDLIRFSTTIEAPAEGCLLWYAFAFQMGSDDDRRYLYYGNNDRKTGGEGKLYFDYEIEGSGPPPFQITVYKEAPVPSWYRDGIVYQIFPDRFARDEAWKERCTDAINKLNARPGGEKRILEEDWDREAYYIRDENNRVTGWPIYGGSFKGIEEKLDYLRSLGVTAIYLNPIFEATSNHRYDTADYMKPDPALGTEEEFSSLAAAAREKGIRIFLDGVFSHTGADSVYFDRFGNYDGTGAYHNVNSPYRSWYRFTDEEPSGYRSWWGVDDLPEVEENDPGFRELINGENGVISHWMDLGASGWRLDVADELPDSFIREVRSRVKQADPDGLLIGEVWEDASNKISYGERRRYFMGDELDGVMNYPLRSALLDYINYTVSSKQAGEMLLSLKENYPAENFYGGLNLIGSHDRERIITAMAAKEDYPSAVKKVRILSVLQYTLPGVPCIYYGDEVGLTGGVDPENRNAYPWKRENLDLGYHYRMLGLIYDEHPVLKGGDFDMLSGKYGIGDDIFAFLRTDETEKVLVLANRSYGPADVDLRECREAGGRYALELLSSEEVKVNPDGFDEIFHMEPLSVLIISIMDEVPEGQKFRKGAGVICHISSLGKRVLGTPAKEFADYLASAGMSIWQVLPLNPAGLGGSPYSSFSAFAGNPDFINRDELPDSSGFKDFCTENKDWLCEYAAFTTLRELFDHKCWNEWPDKYKFGDPQAVLEELYPDHSERIEELVRDQYYFHMQWQDLRQYANSLGIRMMGDLPMYMAGDSADVWANKDVFRMDENGRLSVHAGVPPDPFSQEGQDWGNPLYDWDHLKANGYGWWLRRLRQCAGRFDILRIDHFRGFSEYFAIPYGQKPVKGVWQHSAGIFFLRAVSRMLKEEGCEMKLLAEDLGFLDAGVRNLLKLSGLPGMDIWQFSAGEMVEMKPEKAASRVFYTGTHDNDTLIGFIREKVIPEMDEEQVRAAKTERSSSYPDHEEYDDADPDEKRRIVEDKTRGLTEEELKKLAEKEALRIMEKIYESPAPLAMVQLQDMFMLGTEARMNVPGIAEGNWTWKIPGDSVHDAFRDADEKAAWFRELAAKNGRI